MDESKRLKFRGKMDPFRREFYESGEVICRGEITRTTCGEGKWTKAVWQEGLFCPRGDSKTQREFNRSASSA